MLPSFIAKRLTCAATLIVLALTLATAHADDWPCYRGPKHDGTSAETGIAKAWAEHPPKQLWKIPIGEGFGTFAVVGDKAYIFVAREGNEVLLALDANTGKELWNTPIDQGIEDRQGGSNPRSTPTIDGDRVYVLGTFLKLFCIDAKTGKPIWTDDILRTTKVQRKQLEHAWGSAASPVIDGEYIYVCGGPQGHSMLAFDKKTGKDVWGVGNEKMTHASPVPATIAGVRQVIFYTQAGLVSLKADNGAQLWKYDFPYHVSTAADPVVCGKDGDIVYCSGGYGTGSAAVKVTKSGNRLVASQLWKEGDHGENVSHWSTPLYHDGYLYGIFGFKSWGKAPLKCYDVNGTAMKEIWSKPGFGSGGGVIYCDGHLLVQGDAGPISWIPATPSAPNEDGKIPSIGNKCWCAAIIANGRIYARSQHEAVCFDVTGK